MNLFSISRCFAILCSLAAQLSAATSTVHAEFTFTYTADADPVTEGFAGDTIFGAPSTSGPLADDEGLPAWTVIGTAQNSQYAYDSGDSVHHS